MRFCNIHQLNLPGSFPFESFEQFYRPAHSLLMNHLDIFGEFAGATNLIAWRFRSCVEYKDEYISLWQSKKEGYGCEDIYYRERTFFGMFVSGLSSIESACYACHTVAAASMGLPFAEKSRRHSTPKKLCEELCRNRPDLSLVSVLSEMLSSDEWELLISFRNSMTHRKNIPRITYGSLGKQPPPEKLLQFAGDWSRKALEADADYLDNLIKWIAETLEKIFEGGRQLFEVRS